MTTALAGQGLAAAAEAARALTADEPTLEQLAADLYGSWYAAPVANDERETDLPDSQVALLRAAHAGNDRWEGDWTAVGLGPSGQIIATHNGERRLLDRSEYVRKDHRGIVAAVGTQVLTPSRRDHSDEGWWYTHSPHWRLDAPAGPLVRVYWNVSARDVAVLVRELTARLIDYPAPWMLKCAADRASYKRADATVLFLTGEHLERARHIVDESRSALTPILRPGTPPLTLAIGSGVAVCDDPGTGDSFGEHRCRLIAAGTLRTAPEDPRSAIADEFRRAGIPPERPYIAAASRKLPWE
jgi:hypothetical protein